MVDTREILVIEDQPSIRGNIERLLRLEGFAVLSASDGVKGLQLARAYQPSLVLCDIVMPHLDGYGVLERMHADTALREIPVIMITAVGDIESVVRCIELGAEDYLPKPFDPVLLKARVGASLEKKRLRDEQRRLLETVEAQAAQLREWNGVLEARVAEQVAQVERMSQLQRFLAPQLAQVILNQGEALLESHRSEITVLMCDLRGWTAFAETAEPEDVMAVLRELHGAVGPLIFRYEGTLERFTGDGMMVFFNDPLPCDDPAWRAVQLAMGMRTVAGELAVEWRKRGHNLELGLGIAMGFATCGRIGFEGRFDYGAIGTVTNLSARLCGEAKGGQILVSQRIKTQVEDRVPLEPIGELVLKNFARPIPAFSVG